jgi:hypothetical protein
MQSSKAQIFAVRIFSVSMAWGTSNPPLTLLGYMLRFGTLEFGKSRVVGFFLLESSTF